MTLTQFADITFDEYMAETKKEAAGSLPTAPEDEASF